MYTNIECIYATKLAENARKHCETHNIIQKDKIKLDYEDLKNIINHFGGNLKESDKEIQYLQKVKTDEFDIYYLPFETTILQLAYALGKTFFEFEKMDLNEVRLYLDSCDNLKKEDPRDIMMAKYFSRAFIMPRKLYEEISVKTMTLTGGINVTRIAEEFGVYDSEAIIRGREANIITDYVLKKSL